MLPGFFKHNNCFSVIISTTGHSIRCMIGTMNIQQYFEEREKHEQEKAEKQKPETQPTVYHQNQHSKTIPVVQEQARIDTVETESAKIHIHKTVTEVEKTVNVPLMKEGYHIERVPVNSFVEAAPPVREEGDTVIIPVVREVLVVEKRLELVEEVHITKQRTTVERQENFTLRKEEVNIERIPIEKRKP